MSKVIEDFIGRITGKNIHIVGFSGTESAAVALFLNKYGVSGMHLHDFSEQKQIKKHFKNAHAALDAHEQDERLAKLLSLPAKFHYLEEYLEGINKADIIFVPQAWYMYECNKPLLKLQSVKAFYSITKLYFDLSPAKIIGVTGSNGKTTTSNLINHLFNHADNPYRKIWFSGNDRGTEQILERIEEIESNDLMILEISNRQLKVDLGKSPNIGIVTNITQNHLKEYDSFDDYVQGKLSIFRHQKSQDYAIFNYDDPVSSAHIDEFKNVFGFSVKKEIERGIYIAEESVFIKPGKGDKAIKVCSVLDIPLKGEHNLSNALAALAAGFLGGILIDDLPGGIQGFGGVPQRQELVDTIDGVEFYNDSSSTSPESLIVAVNSLGPNPILIIGGRNKNLDIDKVSNLLQQKVERIIFLDSPFADELKASFSADYLTKTQTVKSLKEAVKLSFKIAKPKDKVVLSPGAEYFVYFKDKMPGYKSFRTFVGQLKK